MFSRRDQIPSPLDLIQVPVPDFWEIRVTNIQGEIWLGRVQRGIIALRQADFRKVEFVEWWSLEGEPISRDYYNAYGWRYAQEIFNTLGKVTYRYHYNNHQELCIIDDYMEDRLILFKENIPHSVPQSEFLSWFLREYIEEDMLLLLGEPDLVPTLHLSNLRGVWTGFRTLIRCSVEYLDGAGRGSLYSRLFCLSGIRKKRKGSSFRPLVFKKR